MPAQAVLSMILILICLCGGRGAAAFEAGGFRTGMDRNDIALKLKDSVRVQKADPSSLLSIDREGNVTSFDLCNGTLVSMEAPRKTDSRQFVTLVREYTQKYGQPVLAGDGQRQLPPEVTDAVGLRWKVAGEYVSLYFISLPGGDSLRVFYQSPNSCYPFPR